MTPKKPDKPKEPTSASAPTTMAKAPEAPKPVVPTVQPQQVNKQQTTIAKLKEGWAQRGIDLGRLIEKQDGKFILLLLPNFPVCKVGPSGGLEVALPSYQSAYDAAINGDMLLAKLLARQAKKAAGSTPAPAPAKPQPAPASKQETPAVRKARKDAALETQLA